MGIDFRHVSPKIRARILHLHTVENLNSRQIAERLGLSARSVGRIIAAGEKKPESKPDQP